MRHLIAAIDLGTTKVVCLVGEKTPSGIKIIGYSQAPSKGVLRGEVINIQHVLDVMTPVLKEVENAIGHHINEVFVGITGQNIRCTSMAHQATRKQPEELITQDEIEAIAQNMYGTFVQNGEKVIHVIPQSYNIDDYMGITEPVGMIGQDINANFKILTGKNTAAQFSNNVITRAGLKLRDLALAPLAAAKAVLTDEEREVGVAMLDIGGGTADLVIIQDNIVRHAAVIPFGGNSITEDIRIGCGISSKHAEQLKIQHGFCMNEDAPEKTIIIPGIGGREGKEISFKLLADIIEARMAEIFEAADYYIEQSGYKNQLQAGIVITGGTSRLFSISKLAKLVTGMECRVAYPDENISSDSLSDVFTPAASTAVGLILYGFEKMAREKTIYKTATEINYEFFGSKENENGTEEKVEEIAQQEQENNKKEEKKEPEKPKKSLGSRLKDFFSSDKMFNQDNEA